VVKSKAEVVQATKNEIQSTWRVYVKEWLQDDSDCTRESLEERFQAKYGGRLEDDDWRIVGDDEFPENPMEFFLQVRLWNVKGEWKYPDEAEEHARLLREVGGHPEAEAVARNSRREHVLMSYGKLMLKEAKNDES
jgi:hypothetical protein